MIDIHCHILPFTDDGPKSWEVALQMCEQAANDGVTHIVATPHCNTHYPFNHEACARKIDELRTRFSDLQFSLGCEVTLSDDSLRNALERPDQFTIGETSYILIEANEAYMPKQVEDALGELISCGLSPILAHPERNSLMKRRLDLLEAWIEMGCLAALTGNSLLGFWGSDTKKIAETMLKKGLVHFLVSDGHNPERRPPILAQAVKAASAIVGAKRARDLVLANPLSVVQGDSVAA